MIIFYITASIGQEVESDFTWGFWFGVSHEVALKTLAGAAIILGREDPLPGASEPTVDPQHCLWAGCSVPQPVDPLQGY